VKHVFSILKTAWRSIKNEKASRYTVWFLWLLTLSYYVVRMLNPLLQSALLDGTVSLFGNKADYSLLVIGFLGLLLMEGVLALYNGKWGILFAKANNEICIGIQSNIYDKLCKIPYSAFNSPKIYEKIDLVTKNYAGYCSGFLAGRTLSSLVGTFISFIFTTVVLIKINPIIALIVVLGNLFGIFKTWLEARLNYYAAVEKMKERRFADAYRSTLFNRNNIKEIRVFGLTDYIFREWYRHTSRVNQKTMSYNALFLLLDFGTYFISNLFTVLSLLLTAKMILADELSIGTFLLVYSSSGALIDTSGSLFGAMRELKLSSYYHTLYEDFMSMSDVETDKSISKYGEEGSIPSEISFDHVCYTYEGSSQRAIDDLCLHIETGEKLAIVGENGCGKSTLVALLNKLYLPDSGEISIAGIPLNEQLSGVQGGIVTVFQDFGKYETTFRENIIMAEQFRVASDAEILSCIHKTGLSTKIESLEKGLDTPIGRFAPEGIDLSGGEWQKLAIARSLFCKNTRVLVMDEPNATLDPLSEATIYNQMLNIAKDETLILITHRLGAIKYVDRIVVMDRGHIIEDGSHDVLMQKGGKYYEMYTAQAKWYKD